MDDLKDLKLKRKNVSDETLASTRRMLGLVHESQDAGVKTLQMLHTQGDQLNSTERGLDDIHGNLLISEKHLKKMEQVEKCYCCAFCHKGNKGKQEHQETGQSTSPTNRIKAGYDDDQNTNIKGYKSTVSNRKSFAHVGKSNRNGTDEGESNLDEINLHVKTLKSQAANLGHVVTSHNSQLSRMNNKAETNDVKLKEVSQRTTNLLKSTSSTFPTSKCCRYFARLFNHYCRNKKT